MRRWLLIILPLVLVFACSSGDHKVDGGDVEVDSRRAADLVSRDAVADILLVDASPEVPGQLHLGNEAAVWLGLNLEPLSLKMKRGGEVLFDGAVTPLWVGVVDEFSETTRYDPQVIHETVRWVPVENPVAYRLGEDDSHVLTFEPEPGLQLELEVWEFAEETFSLRLTALPPTRITNVRLEYSALDEKENFYGLGENFDHVARRGTSRHMYHTIDGESESGYNEAHFPIPLLISTAGSGLFVEERRPGFFDVCDSEPTTVKVTFSTDRFHFHLMAADTPLEVLSRYVNITGLPALPPQWTFGVLQWRNEVSGQAMVMDDASQMRELDLPCSGLWIDRPFATGHESFVFDPARYPDSEQMVKDLNNMGYRVAIWSAPYLSEDVPEAYAEAEANGYFVESSDINFQKFGKLVDFTHPDLVTLWQSLIANATDIGIEGFKLDYGEDVLTGGVIFGQPIKFNFSFHNGESEQTMHHWYHYFYHKTYQDMLDGDGFLLNRAGCFGDQRVTTVCWPGDLDSDYHFHKEDGHVGGLPAAIAGGLSLSTSGYPFYGSDTGGYRHNRPTKEVLLRWVQYSAFGTHLQFGGGGSNHNPWDFSKYTDEVDGAEVVSQYDEETVDIWRTFSRLHIRLFPYTYTYAVQASLTGVPVLRPLGLVHPELGEHPDFHYFFGENLWVAPAHRGGAKVETFVPPGKWIHLFTGQTVDGPGLTEFDLPLDEAVVLVRAGAILPMLRETVDTLAPAPDPDVDSFADDSGDLVVRVYPGEIASQFESVLGPAIAVAPGSGGLELTYQSVEPAFTGLRFKIYLGHLWEAPDSIAKALDGSGKKIPEVESPAGLPECGACYFWDVENRVVEGRLPPSSGSLSLSY